MFLLNRKSIFKKVLLLSFSCCFLVMAIYSIINQVQNRATAATAEGDPITITYADDISYGDDYHTHMFNVGVGGQTGTGFCANPRKKSMEGTFPAIIMPNSAINQRIKLMIYIATVSNSITTPIMNSFFSGVSNPNLRYAYSHAVIGALYDNDYYKLTSSEEAMIRNIYDIDSRGVVHTDKLGDLINANSDAWLIAKNYQLYTIDRSNTPYDGDRYQDIVWIEPNYQYGNIKVVKRDIDTQSTTSPGNANLQGITFSVYNNSGGRIYNPSNNTFYDQGALVASGVTNANGEVSFSNLLLGAYQVRETGTNNSYNLTATAAQNATLTTSGQTQTLTFYNRVIRGDVKFKKVDKNSGDAMANIPFRIKSNTTGESHIVVTDTNGVVNTNSSVNLHSYQTNGYDSIADPDTITYQGYGTWFSQVASSSIPVNDALGALPYDTYTVTEIACDQNKFCYDIDSEVKTFSITTDSTTVDLGTWDNDCAPFSITTVATDNSDGDKFIAADAAVEIKDTIDFCAKVGAPFTIKGILMNKTTGQPIMQNGVIIEESLNVTSTLACEQVEMVFQLDASLLASHEIVVFEYLYYGSQLVSSHEDIDDIDQTVSVIKVETFATEIESGNKDIIANGIVQIRDEVKYCLLANTEFTIKGILMNKNTKQPLLVNGQTVEQDITFTTQEACGTTEIIYEFDATGLDGISVVIFEDVYMGTDLIIHHDDFENADETFNLVPIPPDTGFFTKNTNGKHYTFNTLIILAVATVGISVGIYGYTRFSTRRRFLGRR